MVTTCAHILYNDVYTPTGKSYLATDHSPQRRTVADKMSPMRLLAKSREDTLNEINRKMQRALEETLIKNIHLQEVTLLYRPFPNVSLFASDALSWYTCTCTVHVA